MPLNVDRLAKIALGVSLAASLFAGCDKKPQRVDLPGYDSNSGAAAIAAYDSNKDGKISGDELLKTPALASALAQIDANNDKAISADEIDARIRKWRDSRVGVMSVACKVFLNGSPLPNAQVVFDPEPFLGSSVKPASGVSLHEGTAVMSIAKENLPNPSLAGVACGFYTIRVTCNDRPIPKKFNVNSTLGCVVALDAPWVGAGEVKLELTSN